MKLQSSLDLGVIGNAAVAALVDKSARLVWMCAPRMDGDPVFCRLLKGEGDDAAGGEWSISIDDCVAAEQTYIRNTAILETILTDRDGNRLRIRDFAPRFKRAGRIFRPVTIVRNAAWGQRGTNGSAETRPTHSKHRTLRPKAWSLRRD